MDSTLLRFGDFELDVPGYQLSSKGSAIKLERVPLELLLLLIEHRNRVVTRDEIVRRLWGKDRFLDVDNGINTAVRKIRQVLKDDPERPSFIRTLTGKGYRFIAAIEPSAATAAVAVQTTAQQQDRVMLVVLPFENLSNDPEQEYFSDGLTEETISRLGAISPERMGVIARTSSMAYKHTTKGIDQIGRELGVQYVLESSVRRDGNRVRTAAQLIRVKDQTHVWASSYDRQGSGFLAMQEDLGNAIAHQVQVMLTSETGSLHRHNTQDRDAHDLYLRGRYYWNQLTPPMIRKGIDFFDLAVARDPEYALAYAGMAECYSMLPITCDAPALEILPRAKDAAQRAVELDDTLAEAHASLGSVKVWMEWDWQGAETALIRAIELNPSYVTAHRWYAVMLSHVGRHREAAEQMRRAREVDPLSPIMHALSGQLLYHGREYDRALEHLQNALAINPNLWIVHTFLGRTLERKGRWNEALEELQKAFDLSGGNTEAMALKGYIYAERGERANAQQVIRILEDLSSQRYVPPYNIAMVYAGLGEIEVALDWLEKAYATRDVRLGFLAIDAKWDYMRMHSRFQNLLRRLALPLEVCPW